MAAQKILVVEDDKHISQLLKYNLEKAGYECATTITGEDAVEELNRSPFDLIILDIMLPKMDGFEVCRRIKRDESLKYIPIIMLTARGEEVDRVVGLELGADDYIVKPFSPRELILRIKAVLRRSKPVEKNNKKDNLTAGPLVVDIPRHRVTVNGKEISLTPMEFNLLVLFMERQGRVQTRDGLLAEVWDIHADVYTRTVDTHIKRLREKLGKAGARIETVIGLGYKFRQEDE
jgi:DNA-binding response OmpR family regulator